MDSYYNGIIGYVSRGYRDKKNSAFGVGGYMELIIIDVLAEWGLTMSSAIFCMMVAIIVLLGVKR